MEDAKKYFPNIHDLKSPQDIINLYKEWARNYDNEMVNINLQTHHLVAKTIVDLNISTEAKIVDVGAGTGAVAKLLKSSGYIDIDALDCSNEMLEIARKQDLYQNYIEAIIGEYGSITQIENDTYDVASCAGVFAPNHLTAKVFPELLRITKPGGVIIMIRGLQYAPAYPELGQDFVDEVEKLIADGKWKRHVQDIYIEDYLDGNPALINVMEKK